MQFCIDPHQPRIRPEIELVALGIDYLWNKGDFRQTG